MNILEGLENVQEWQSIEPDYRGFEIRITAGAGETGVAVTFWSLSRHPPSTRWGIITGYGDTIREAHRNAIERRRERIPGWQAAGIWPEDEIADLEFRRSVGE